MKKAFIILTLIGFVLPTLLMPYANFDDTRSLQAVYNNCLRHDTDMDFLEFVGEKMLSAGFDPGEEKEERNQHPNKPVAGVVFVQIHAGAFVKPVENTIDLSQPEFQLITVTIVDTTFHCGDFRPGIFHPPLAVS